MIEPATGPDGEQTSWFCCPNCIEIYKPHWRDPQGANLCRVCARMRRGECQFTDHPGHLSLHPCAYGTEAPGEPCRYCARPVPADDSGCPFCWTQVEGLSMADLKALFAADETFSLDPGAEERP